MLLSKEIFIKISVVYLLELQLRHSVSCTERRTEKRTKIKIYNKGEYCIWFRYPDIRPFLISGPISSNIIFYIILQKNLNFKF